MVTRVERHVIKESQDLQDICHKAKNLYNYANYLIRQNFFAKTKLPSAYSLINDFTRQNQPDYRALPPQTAQQVIRLLGKNWKSFLYALADYQKNPNKYLGRPKPPRYKKKDGLFITIFTNQQVKLFSGFIYFPSSANLPPLKTKVDVGAVPCARLLKQVRIIPQATCFVVEVVYQTDVPQALVSPENVLAIDLGLNNLATCVNNVGFPPFIINGKTLKSINQYFNKKRAKLMSFIGNRGFSKRLSRLTFHRNMKVNDYLHKASAIIRSFCVANLIGTVVIGYSPNWKQGINLGKRNNQNFVNIPFDTLLRQLQYKLGDVGVKVFVTEESYTSKVDHLAFETLQQQTKYKGTRVKRGLFQSSVGFLLNADVNGAIGIARKVVGDTFVQTLLNRGVGFTPGKVRTNFNTLPKFLHIF